MEKRSHFYSAATGCSNCVVRLPVCFAVTPTIPPPPSRYTYIPIYSYSIHLHTRSRCDQNSINVPLAGEMRPPAFKCPTTPPLMYTKPPSSSSRLILAQPSAAAAASESICLVNFCHIPPCVMYKLTLPCLFVLPLLPTLIHTIPYTLCDVNVVCP